MTDGYEVVTDCLIDTDDYDGICDQFEIQVVQMQHDLVDNDLMMLQLL